MSLPVNWPSRKTLLACCAAAAAFASLAPTSFAQQADPAPEWSEPGQQALAARPWQLQTVRGKHHAWFTRAAAALPAPVQLRFDATHVSVDAPCNALRGRYLLSGSRMLIEPLAGTKKACADARLMALEDQLEQALPQVKDWQVQAGGQQLRLRFLDGSQWQLAAGGAHAAQPRSEPVFLEVAAHTRPCAEARRQPCLLVRQVRLNAQGERQPRDDGPWQLLARPIEGFTHESGARVVLRVRPQGQGYVLEERIRYEAE